MVAFGIRDWRDGRYVGNAFNSFINGYFDFQWKPEKQDIRNMCPFYKSYRRNVRQITQVVTTRRAIFVHTKPSNRRRHFF